MRLLAATTAALALLWCGAPCNELTGGTEVERVTVATMANDLVSVEIDDTEPVDEFVLLPSLDLVYTVGIGARFAVTVDDAYAWDLAGSFEANPTVDLVPWAVAGADPNKVVTGQVGDADPPLYFTKDYELSMWGNGQSWIYWEVTVTNVQATPLPAVKLYAWMLSPTADMETGAYNTGGAGPLRLFLNGTSGSIGYGPLPTAYPVRYMTCDYVSGNPAGDVDDYIYGDATWTAPHPGNDLPNTVETASAAQEMGIQWTIGDISAGGSATVGFIFAGGVDQAAVEVAIEDGIAMVPVELASFQAHAVGNGVRLSWVTLSERDNLGFHVLRAEEHSSAYRQISSRLIKGAGTTTANTEYEYVDADVVAGNGYSYKLQQIDVGGATTYYGPVAAVVPVRSSLSLDLGPNPSSGDLMVFLSFPATRTVEVSVKDVAGRRVESVHAGAMGGGCHTIQWRASEDLPAGLYIVEAQAGDLTATRRWVLLP